MWKSYASRRTQNGTSAREQSQRFNCLWGNPPHLCAGVLGDTCQSLWGKSVDSKWNFFITFWCCRFHFNILLKTVTQTLREEVYRNIGLSLAQSLCSVYLNQHFQRSPLQSKSCLTESCPTEAYPYIHTHTLFCWWEWCGRLSLYLEIFRWIRSSFPGSF